LDAGLATWAHDRGGTAWTAHIGGDTLGIRSALTGWSGEAQRYDATL
jgi:hypothetical protein